MYLLKCDCVIVMYVCVNGLGTLLMLPAECLSTDNLSIVSIYLTTICKQATFAAAFLKLWILTPYLFSRGRENGIVKLLHKV